MNYKSSRQKQVNLRNSEIRLLLNELHSKFSSIPLPQNSPYDYPFEIKDNMIYDSNVIQILQKVSENMCYYLGLFTIPSLIYIEEESNNKQNKIFTCTPNGTIHTYEKEKDFAGLYESSNVVTIVKKSGYTIKNLLGTLAHEITHHFLRHHNINKLNKDENEIFTDITSIYIGFGHLLYSAYKTISFNTDWKENSKSISYIKHERTIGYITPGTIMKAISLTCEMRNWNTKELIKKFDTFYDKVNISAKLLKYRMKLFKTRFSHWISESKSKREKNKMIEVVEYMKRIQNKYDEVKIIMNDTSKFTNKTFSKDDGELLVNITNDIYASITEEDIKTIITKVNKSITDTNKIKDNIYKNSKQLDKKINRWLTQLDKIVKQ